MRLTTISGETVREYEIADHARASDGGSIAANASKVMLRQRRRRARLTNADQREAGMPLVFQELTVDSGKPSSAASAPVPPKSSMTESGVCVDMPTVIVRTARTSQEFATCETTFSVGHVPIFGMYDPPEIIGPRLKRLRVACGYRFQKDFAKSIGVEKNTYNPWETGARDLTFEGALLIKKRHRIPLDYLFFGELEDEIPSRILKLLQRAA